VGQRVHEALNLDMPPRIIVTDSQRFHGTDFLEDLNERQQKKFADRNEGDRWVPIEWTMLQLKGITASGILIEEDQTYDIQVRVLDLS